MRRLVFASLWGWGGVSSFQFLLPSPLTHTSVSLKFRRKGFAVTANIPMLAEQKMQHLLTVIISSFRCYCDVMVCIFYLLKTITLSFSFKKRQFGLKCYWKTSLERNDLTLLHWVNHFFTIKRDKQNEEKASLTKRLNLILKIILLKISIQLWLSL